MLWGGKCPLKFLAFKGEFKNSCVAQKPIISSLRCLLLTLCKNIKKVMKAIMLRENNIFWQRIQVLLFRGLIFYKWQILNWLALHTLQQKYMERYLFSIQYVLFPLRQEQRWPQFSVHLMPKSNTEPGIWYLIREGRVGRKEELRRMLSEKAHTERL